MNIDRDNLIEWIEDKFGDIQVNGDEIKIHDPWWINENGGKDNEFKCWINIDKQCYHAFKSGETGSLLKLVAETENCDWDEAVEIIGGQESIRSMEKRLMTFLNNPKPEPIIDEKVKAPKVEVQFPEHTMTIQDNMHHPIARWAAEYLQSRNIDYSNILVCTSGEYYNRLVIPYYDKNDSLIYFNTRSLSNKSKLRYKGPKKEEFNIGKADVLWIKRWPKIGSKIYLTEGEFDAMTLTQCGLYAAACGGKSLSPCQSQMLSDYKIALSFDADKAGEDVFNISQSLLAKGQLYMNGDHRISIIRPPAKYKDWNKFYIEIEKIAPGKGKDTILKYIERFEKKCQEDTMARMQFSKLKT